MERVAGFDDGRTADGAAGDGADFGAGSFSPIVDWLGQPGRAANAENFLSHAGLDNLHLLSRRSYLDVAPGPGRASGQNDGAAGGPGRTGLRAGRSDSMARPSRRRRVD